MKYKMPKLVNGQCIQCGIISKNNHFAFSTEDAVPVMFNCSRYMCPNREVDETDKAIQDLYEDYMP